MVLIDIYTKLFVCYPIYQTNICYIMQVEDGVFKLVSSQEELDELAADIRSNNPS